MGAVTATAEAVWENFDKYLTNAQDNGEILITENGKPVARLLSQEKVNSILSERALRMVRQKYGNPTNTTENAANESID